MQRRVERGDLAARTAQHQPVTVQMPVFVTAPAYISRARQRQSSSDTDNGAFILTGAAVLVAGWLVVQHSIIVTAVLLGAAAGVVAAVIFTLLRSVRFVGSVPGRAAVPLSVIGLGVATPIAASIAFNTVRFDGSTVWQMGAIMQSVPSKGSGVAGFIQNVVGQYVHLAERHGLQSIVLIAYAVACAFACLIVTAVAAVELLDWNLHIAAAAGAVGAFTRRRAARLERQRWWTPSALVLVPAVALTAFVGLPAFLSGLVPTPG